MPGLTKKQLDQLKGLKGINQNLLAGYQPNMQSAPQGQVLGANSTLPAGLNAAQLGGASGLGFETPEDQAKISEVTKNTIEAGGSRSQVGDSVSGSQAQSLLKGGGLQGIIDPKMLAGRSFGEATTILAREREKRTGQISANTSYSFNPQTLSGLKKSLDRIQLGLTDIQSDPFKSKQSIQDKMKATLEAGAKDIANLFSTAEELQMAMQANPQMAQLMDTFQNMGGDVTNVQANIAPQGATMPQNQSTADYLGNINNPMANKQAEEQAMNELIPERAIYQEEIMRQAQIPEDLKNLYFGTEQEIGIIQMKKAQAEEEKRIIEEREKDDKQSLQSQARLAIQKNSAEATIQKNKVEENRLAAKNYMTGMLAKLGALTTTGAAPLALQTLETKYQNQAQELDMTYKFATREIENQLESKLNDVENDTDSMILKLEQDLTKDYEDIVREIQKAQQTSARATYTIKEKYASELRARTTKYTADMKREAEAYAKKFLKTASGGLDVAALGGLFSLKEGQAGTLQRGSSKTALGTSYSKVKQDLKANLPAAISTKIISELTDEQMALFTDDYLDQRVNQQQSFNPSTFYEEWKKTNGIKQEKEESGVSSKAQAYLDSLD